MAKKKTSVILPGGIAGLVQNAQQGIQQPPLDENLNDNADTAETDKPEDVVSKPESEPKAETKTRQADGDKKVRTNDAEPKDKNTAETTKPSAKAGRVGEKPAKPERPAAATSKNNNKPAASDAPSADDERSYSLTPKNSADESWQMFLDMAHEYKQRQAPIATIYIDEELKRVLDRLKTAGPSRLSTTSIVSSIVARFIFDHEREIKELLYKEL